MRVNWKIKQFAGSYLNHQINRRSSSTIFAIVLSLVAQSPLTGTADATAEVAGRPQKQMDKLVCACPFGLRPIRVLSGKLYPVNPVNPV